jgi:hypothetical protein
MRHVILHGHIFKNAGTTFDWSLQNNFGDNFLDHRQDQLMRTEGRAHVEELLTTERELCALSSHHMTNDLPVMSAVNFIRVCLLRHPIERIRSVYDFERTQQAHTPGAKAAKSMDFKDYVQWRMLPQVAHTIRNYQTLYLAGAHGLADEREMAVKYLPDALAVARGDALIGLVERYDESMVVLEDSLAGYFPGIDLSYVAQNVSKVKRQEKAAPDPVAKTLQELGDLQRTVIDKNSFDLALYQVVSERLDGRILGIERFEEKLANFQKRCRRLQRERIIVR